MQEAIGATITAIITVTTYLATKAKYNSKDKKTDSTVIMKTLELFSKVIEKIDDNTKEQSNVAGAMLSLAQSIEKSAKVTADKLDVIHRDVNEVSAHVIQLDKRVSKIEKEVKGIYEQSMATSAH